MNARALVATTAALGVVLAGSAIAAPKPAPKPKPVCNLLTDPAGDTFAARSQETAGQPGPQEDTLDILSVDVASNATTIAGVVRVKKVAKSGQTSPSGNGYAVDFFLPGSVMTMSLRATYTPSMELYEASFKDESIPNSPSTMLAVAKGTLDAAKNEVRIWAPVSAFASQGGLKPGQKIVGLKGYTGRSFPPAVAQPGQVLSPRFLFADATGEGKTYTAGAPSCLPVGK